MTNPTIPPIVCLHPSDHVAVAVRALQPGQTFRLPSGVDLHVIDAVPAGHKIAISERHPGDPVFKFNNPIGIATTSIRIGQHVHSHNLVDDHDRQSLVAIASPSGWATMPTPNRKRTFLGFDRGSGRVGTRNYVLIASRVNCSATVCHQVAQRFPIERLAEFPNVDGLAIATHTTGCALAYAGLKQQMLGRVLRGYASHPNVGGCLMIGLGCEQTTPEYLEEHHGLVQIGQPRINNRLGSDATLPIEMLTMQTEGGTRATIDRAERLIEKLLDSANRFERTVCDASHLKIALECGGSDGYSGWTANPAVGAVADRVIDCGGAAVLSETTEIYGAEQLLVGRSVSAEVAQRLLDKIQWWKNHVAMYGGEIDNNPSIGNKAGGLTTITEKSLGAVAKSGSHPLCAVLDYAASVPDFGLSVMDTPGFDPSSVTGKVAGGCNLVLFTTGRGSCFGGKPVPVIKVASNSVLFESMPEDMDLDAGQLLPGKSIDQLGDEFFEYVLQVASGHKTHSERLGLGDHEFVPWTVGPVL